MLRDAASAANEPGPTLAELHGHSGARITIHGSGSQAIVRKSAGHAGQNLRLRQQAEKQARFHAAGAPVPPVLRVGRYRGLFYFDMPHLASVSLAAHCENGAAQALRCLPDFVAAWIDRMRPTVSGTVDTVRVEAKIDNVLEQARSNVVLHDAMPAVTLLGSVLRRVDWRGLPQSDCHGDLTLENILLKPDGTIALIDCDVPDLTGLWFDLAKLYQDFDGFWCLRGLAREGASLRFLNAVLALRRLRAVVDEVVAAELPELPRLLPALVGLNLLRTLPYCTETATALFVIDRARVVLSKLDPGSLG